jgi:uncharacterized protein (TIGR02145 family)
LKKPVAILSIFLFILLSISSQIIKYETVTDIDNNLYQTVKIGKYEWMAENLRTTTFSNGEKIPLCIENDKWSALGSCAYCWYNNEEKNIKIYGALYNWYSVSSGTLCPVGWRVPSDEDWKYLTGFVDTRIKVGDTIWNKKGLKGYDSGKRLKALTGWNKDGNGTDNFGFSALPGGERSSKDGLFHLRGYNGYWWSSTGEGIADAWYRSIIYSLDDISRDVHGKKCGFSVRCIRDI